MNDDMNRNDENDQEQMNRQEEAAAGLTPEEEAAKAIEEAKAADAERDAAERMRREAEWEDAYRRAEAERRREQEETAAAIRRENEAKEAARKAAQEEKKERKKKGLRLTAAVLAIVLLVGAAGYAAGHITKTIQGLQAEISSLQGSEKDRVADGTVPGDQSAERPTRPERNSESSTSEATETSAESRSIDPVIGTAEDSDEQAIILTDVSEIVEKALPSVVSVTVTETVSYNSYWGSGREYEQSGAGSGIIIGDDGEELWIVSNYHVIEGADTIKITFSDDETVSAYVKGTDKNNDLAVIGVRFSDMKQSTIDSIKVIKIGESDDLKLGQGVIAIGNALGWGQSVTTGVVSAFNREVEFEDGTKMFLMQTSAAINPGNSGGALLNAKGELIGINNAKYSDTDVEGVGFAIPISSVRSIMEKLSLMQPRVPVADEDFPYMGVTFKNLSSMYMQSYGIPNGAYIYEVGAGTPAEKAGLLAYDIITAIDDTVITSYDDLVKELQYHKGGTDISLTVMRLNRGEYSEIELTMTLGFRSDAQK